ncbi:hypothetical protein [Thauera chlorobenzoica]|nr:hypothetical protein [Thauera chlorobenzoica]SEG06814.1 hypothetical protein SAMN05216242_11551 [Thauera chlorobenzoica]
MPTDVEIMAQTAALQKQAEAIRQQEAGAVIAGTLLMAAEEAGQP